MPPADHEYSRFNFDEQGRIVSRYRATSPADTAFECNCGKPKCPRARLWPLREHIAVVHRLINEIRYQTEAFVTEGDPWEAVPYHLMMAASIQDVIADTGYLEDPMTFAVCEPTIAYEDANSEMASKYVAGASIFTSLWAAYEAAVAGTAETEHRRLMRSLGERGRRLFESRPEMSARFVGLSDLCGLAEYHCRRGGLFDRRLKDIRATYEGRGLVFAAELGREFRNFVVHGADAVPTHPDWVGGDQVWVTQARLHRFYSVGRLVLMLIQALALLQLETGGWPYSATEESDEEGDLAGQLVSCQFARGPQVT